MRIIIDLGHPAHFHYFKNFIRIMEDKGHEFLLVARDKDVLQNLLKIHGIKFINRGKGGNGFFSRLIYLIKTDLFIFKLARKFKPDMFLSFASSYAAHASFLYRRPHVTLDDTEHSTFELMLYSPFSKSILNPKSFWGKYSNKQLFFDSFIELAYLHPNYLSLNKDVLEKYELINQKYFIVRFISWDANHDNFSKGLTLNEKIKLVELLEKEGKVLISSEGILPENLEEFRLNIDPEDLHSLIYFAHLYIGEGATTASECVMLGTPAIYVNSLNAGTLQEQSEDFGLVSLRNSTKLLEKVNELLSNNDSKEKAKMYREKLISKKIDVTSFLVWFIEHYPESHKTIAENPDFQYQFH